MTKFALSQSYIAASCNRTSGSLCWIESDLLCYACASGIAVCKGQSSASNSFIIKQILSAEGGTVNIVRSIKRGNGLELVSGCSLGNLYFWKDSTLVKTIVGAHAGSIVSLSVLHGADGLLWLASGSTDGILKVWTCKGSSEFTLFQAVDMKTRYPLELEMSILPGTRTPVIAVGATCSLLLLYTMTLAEDRFNLCLEVEGHRDWIRGLSFATNTLALDGRLQADESFTLARSFAERAELADGDLLLASASQDKTVRVWTIKRRKEVTESFSLEEMVNSRSFDFAAVFNGKVIEYTLQLDSILAGHEEWVLDVHWKPVRLENGTLFQPLELLSCSADCSMVVWTPDSEASLWNIDARVGDIGGNSTSFEFYGCQWSPSLNNDAVVAYDTCGALHMWRKDLAQDAWVPKAVGLGGNFAGVTNVAWNSSGDFFGTVSLDQTCRIYAPFGASSDASAAMVGDCAMQWGELARAQIHGYDLRCISFLDDWTFVSGGDEKVLRVFRAPQSFARSVAVLLSKNVSLDDAHLAPSASQPALGLSNKAVTGVEAEDKDNAPLGCTSFDASSIVKTSVHNSWLLEEELKQATLWPEIEKLYGHGFEVVTVSSAFVPLAGKKLIASSCRASKEDFALVRLWEVDSGKELFPSLGGHQLTATCVEFSPRGSYLLTAGRDRHWCLFKSVAVTEDNAHSFEPVAVEIKAHSRIIWSASWHPSEMCFATGSRDKTVKLWTCDNGTDKNAKKWRLACTLIFSAPVTSVSFLPVDGHDLLAVGLESGQIHIAASAGSGFESWSVAYSAVRRNCPSGAINKLSWCPKIIQSPFATTACFVAASSDYTTRLYELCVLD